MDKKQFAQYKKVMEEYTNLLELMKTDCMDVIQDQLTEEQYEEVKLHPGFDYIYV